MGHPFSRFNMLMQAVMSMMSSTPGMRLDAALAAKGGYQSHGKGGKSARRPTGIAKVRRAALKARNVRKNRANHR